MRSFRDLLVGLSTPWHILLKELSAFGVVGAVNLLLQTTLFNGLHFGLRIGPLTSYLAAAAVSTTSAYFMNRHWSFSHRARTGLAREYLLFFGLNGIAVVLGLVVLGATRYGFGLTDKFSLNVANIVGIGLGTIFRFWSYKRWVFVAQEPAPRQEQDQDQDQPAEVA